MVEKPRIAANALQPVSLSNGAGARRLPFWCFTRGPPSARSPSATGSHFSILCGRRRAQGNRRVAGSGGPIDHTRDRGGCAPRQPVSLLAQWVSMVRPGGAALSNDSISTSSTLWNVLTVSLAAPVPDRCAGQVTLPIAWSVSPRCQLGLSSDRGAQCDLRAPTTLGLLAALARLAAIQLCLPGRSSRPIITTGRGWHSLAVVSPQAGGRRSRLGVGWLIG